LVTAVLCGAGDPLIGTVVAMKNDTVTIKDQKDKSIVVILDKRTIFLKDGKVTTRAELKPGVHVVIDVNFNAKRKAYVANDIKIGVAVPASTK
jgi:hypothetical protein